MNTIFNTYIKASSGIVKWLFFIAMNLMGPLVRGMGVLYVIGGGLGFIIFLWSGFRGGFDSAVNGFSTLNATFLSFGLAMLGMAMIIYYEITVDRMFINRLYPDEDQDDDVSRLVRLRNWFGLLVLFVGFSFAAYYRYPSLLAIDWPVIGFIWWLVVGNILGVCRWLYRQGTDAMGVIMELVSKVRSGLVSKSALDKEVRMAAKVFADENKVVQLHKKG